MSREDIFINENKDLPLIHGDGPFMYNCGTETNIRHLHSELCKRNLDPTISIHFEGECLYYTPVDQLWTDAIIGANIE